MPRGWGRLAQPCSGSSRRPTSPVTHATPDRRPPCEIDSVRDDQGQFLYKVRTGSFVNPALARTEAKRLAEWLAQL